MHSLTICFIILLNTSFLLAQQPFSREWPRNNERRGQDGWNWNSQQPRDQNLRPNRQNWNFGDDDSGLNFNNGNNNGRPFNTRRPTRRTTTRFTDSPTSFNPTGTTPTWQDWGSSSSSSTTPNTITSSTIVIPGGETRRPLCEESCSTTPEYNPVCGDDNITYGNLGRLNCAIRCGKRVTVQFYGACS